MILLIQISAVEIDMLLAILGIDLKILTSYTFLVVCLGTVILAAAAGMIGAVTVLKGQSLIGDAIGHASYPGVIIAFMIGMALDPFILLIGATISGALAFILVQVIDVNSKLKLDAVMAVVLSSFFGLGMVLKSYIQGHETYVRVPQGGLQYYIFGQAAFIRFVDIRLILIVAVISIIFLLLFYKEFKLFIFDEVYAKSIGLRPVLLYVVMILMIMGVIATGLKFVGAILISSFLIVPAITALQWSNQFSRVLLIAAVTGSFSAFVGTYLSSVYAGMSTGPSIILVMSGIAFLSLIIGPRGLVANRIRRRKSLNA